LFGVEQFRAAILDAGKPSTYLGPPRLVRFVRIRIHVVFVETAQAAANDSRTIMLAESEECPLDFCDIH